MIWPDFYLILAVYTALILFGVGYNALVSWMEPRGYSEGYMSLIVAGGVLIVLTGFSILSITGAILALGAFGAAGLPMIVGSIARHITAREQAQKAIKAEIDYESQTTTLADNR